MEDLEQILEDMIREFRKKDIWAAIFISSAFVVFGFLWLILTDVLILSPDVKGAVALLILLLTWVLMGVGIYLLTFTPTPRIQERYVADSGGIEDLIKLGYKGKVYVTLETLKRCPKSAGIKLNLEVIDVSEEEAKKYEKYGEELSFTIAAAKKIRAKIVSSSKKNKIEDVKVVRAEDVLQNHT